MPPIIRPDTCSTCPHSVRMPNGGLECHEGPPTAHPVVVMTPQGPRVVDVVSAFPPVQPESHCSRHPRIARAIQAGLFTEAITSPE